jgi:hypothetical protein
MVMVGKHGALRGVGRVLSGTQALGLLCLFSSNGCGANLSRNESAELGCATGTEGCACYGNWSCNYQLSCIDEMCVDRRKLVAEQTQALAKASLRAADPIVSASTEECMTCLESDCVSPLGECYDEAGCSNLIGCLLPCADPTGETYAECAEVCYAEARLTAHAPATQLQICAQSRCEDACGG